MACLLLGAMFLTVYLKGRRSSRRNSATAREMNTQQVGLLIFQNYLLPFEIASLLLLVAIVGAVVMAKKRIS